ncbi:hypothetical protein C8Q76DRAFT_802564 [Earliella scabrosa]|nr:hypothetical protein C8Q76DRAFT_802564 [Earliella scabrosa]
MSNKPKVPRKRTRTRSGHGRSTSAERIEVDNIEDANETGPLRSRRVRIHSPTPVFLSPTVPVGEQRQDAGLEHSPTLECADDLSRMELTRDAQRASRPAGGRAQTAPARLPTTIPRNSSLAASPPLGPVGEAEGGFEPARAATTPPRRLAGDGDRPRTPDRLADLPTPGPVGEWTPRADRPLATGVRDARPAQKLVFALLNSERERSPSPMDGGGSTSARDTLDRAFQVSSPQIDRFAGLPSPGPVGEWTPRADRPSATGMGDARAARKLSFSELNSERSPSPVDNPRLSPLVSKHTAAEGARDHTLQALSHSRTMLAELVDERNSLVELRRALGRTVGMRAQNAARHWLDYNRMLFAQAGNGEGETGDDEEL